LEFLDRSVTLSVVDDGKGIRSAAPGPTPAGQRTEAAGSGVTTGS
jgi:hypothetical protein